MRSKTLSDDPDNDADLQEEVVAEPHWFDQIGIGLMALGASLLALFTVIAMAVFNQMVAARLSEAAVPPAQEVAFEAPEPVIARKRVSSNLPGWKQYAVPFESVEADGLIAVIIMDDGSASPLAQRALEWTAPLTFAVAGDFALSAQRLSRIRRAGREAMVIVPMGYGPEFGRDPNVLDLHLSENELRRRLRWHLARADGYVGVVDGNSGPVMRDEPSMRAVGEELAAQGLVFVDSGAAKGSIAGPRVRALGVPTGQSTVRITGADSPAAALEKLTDAEQQALTWGTAIVMVDADKVAMKALADWLRTRNPLFAIAPVSAVIGQLRGGG